MARTRNLDPGRDPALHYAFTARKRHAKRLVYAFSILVGLAAAGVWPARRLHAEPGQSSADSVPCVACVALSVDPGLVPLLPSRLDALRVLLRIAPGTPAAALAGVAADLRARGGRVGLHFTGIPAADDPVFATAADIIVIDGEGSDPQQTAFALKQALAAARARAPAAPLLVAAPEHAAAELRARGVAPYLTDFIAPVAPIVTADSLLAFGSDRVRVRLLPAEGGREIAAAAAALQPWFPEGLVPARDRPLTCAGVGPLPTYLNARTLDLVALSSLCPPGARIDSDMAGAAIERYDLAPPSALSAFLARAGTGDRFAEGVDVAAARNLTAAEIVARHQAAIARQTRSTTTDIATGTMTLTFEAPGFVAPVTVTSEVTMYQRAGEGNEVRQRNIRVNGMPFSANGGVPRLPIIEPERAAAPPLAITLSDLYTYRLEGREKVRGRDSFVLAFKPRDGGQSLHAGRAWIDAATFGMARISATQTGLRGPVTASEQTDEFAPDPDGRWLLSRSDVRQTYEGASVRTPIHRVLTIAQHDVNRTDFEAQRAAAYASADVMLRDTPQGFRYLARRSPDREPRDAAVAPVRVVAGRAERIRTLAFGAIIDPNISTPLPFAGVSYVDFNLFGTGAQFSGFFGGSYGQLAFSAPSVRGTRWQIAGRAFGIASSYNDRAFEEGREQYDLDIRQRPAQAAVWLLRPLSARTSLRLEYDWDYNRFARGDQTNAAFVVPRNQNAHAIRVGLEAQRNGWQAAGWASYARRIGWRRWGLPGTADYSPTHADFERFGASLARSHVVRPRLTTRLETAIMSGRDLDRFSRYAFGTFDNRLHGYPSALVRYDRGGVIRSAAAWAPGLFRLDGFADAAFVRDPGFGNDLRRYLGLGTAVESPGPFRTLLAVEWGYGFQGLDPDGRKGTHVVRLSGYKIF